MPIVDRTPEKIALMRELGLERAADNLGTEAEFRAQAEKLTAMSFKPTAEDEVRQRLVFRYVDWKSWRRNDTFWFFVIFGAVAAALCVPVYHVHALFPIMLVPGVVSLVVGLASFFTSGLKRTNPDWMRLQDWGDNMPYVALLAVKEAKQLGIADFRVYYPRREESRRRLQADPIIVGTIKGRMVEIFAWDDGKVYE